MSAQVHIVLATYNGEQYLREQLDSILASEWKDLSVEICDDGSSDGTVGIAKEYAAKYPWIRLHRNKENYGYVKNFIEGIKRSESPYIMLCDQDDRWNPDKISRTLARMKELEREVGGERPLLVFTDAENYDSETGKSLGSFHKSSRLDPGRTDPAHLLMENKCIGCTVMVNAAVLPYLKTLPAQVRVHDWWLALICTFFGNISYLPETTLQYRQHSGNMIGGSGFFDYVKDRLRNLGKQRAAIRATFAQGKAFYQLFEGKLQGEDREILAAFAGMEDAGAVRRRWYMLRYGFCKSGSMRNVALFFLI